MIIDLHTQIWSHLDQLGPNVAALFRERDKQQSGRSDGAPQRHEREMQCVDISVVLGYRSQRTGALVPNELVAEYVAAKPKARLGIGAVDPLMDDPVGQVNQISDLGLVGVTMSPAGQGFHPTHSQAMRVYERCCELGMPIFITLHAPMDTQAVLEFGRPMLWDEVARNYPDLSILIGHLGHPWIDETLLLLDKHASIYADVAGVASSPWQLYQALLAAQSLGVMNKLLFGSGFPRETPAKAIEYMYSVNQFSQGTGLPNVPRSLVRDIVERNSLACLGIDVELPTPQVEVSSEMPVASEVGNQLTD